MIRHPSGVGSWKVWLRSRPLRSIVVGGHTAFDAFHNALPFLTRNGDRSFGFDACEFELVSDQPPAPKRERAKKPRKAKSGVVGRLVGAQRGARA